MLFRMRTTWIATLVFAVGFTLAGCGGGDTSPTRPEPVAPTPTPTPTPPPAPTVSVIEVTPNTATIVVGGTQRFVASAKASDGAVISGVDFAWTSSNTAVVTINSGGVATGVMAGSATIRATGNGVSSASIPVTVNQAPVATIAISPSSTQELMVGEMVTFMAMARTAAGAVRGDVSFTWTSSDTTVVTITSGGVATAVGAGMASVKAAADGKESSAVTINVAEPPPPEPVIASVSVTPEEATIEEGQTQQFEAMAATADGESVPDVAFMWSSSDEMVATVDSTGLAMGVGDGDVMITATADGVSGMASLTVNEPPPPEPVIATVTVSPEDETIEVGETHHFEAMAATADGESVPDVAFMWSSSDEMVATVDSTGLAMGVGVGDVMITATADGVSGMASLTVTEPPPPDPVVSTVTVTPASMIMKVGDMFMFTAVATTADGMVIDDVEFTWMSDDTEVATVDDTGLVTAVGAGTAMIAATGNDVMSMPSTVTVEEVAPEVATVEIVDAMPVMLETGGTHQLMAVARTSDGTMVGGVTFAWSSDDNEVATVDSTGLVTAVGAGMADITAMTEDTTSEPVTVTVADPPPVVDRVTVEPMTATIEEGETEQFTATAYDSDDMEITGKTFAWKTGRTNIATIDSTGLATGEGVGSTTITATVDSVSGTATLEVTEPPPVVDRVTVSPSSRSIEEGETQRFTAAAYDSDNDVISGKSFRWTSSNTSVATVSPSSGASTTATGVSAGSTTITASVDGKSGTASLRVTEPPPVVDRVTVSPSSRSIEEGETQRFTAAAYDSDNELISGTRFRWTSSNTTVATVSPSSGTSTTATGESAGSTTITASVDGKSGTASLRVTEPPPVVDRVTVSPSSPSIEEGETQRFTAAAYDSDNELISGTRFRWTSSNTTVATVSPSSGTSTTATGESAGSTTITASVDGKSGTASLRVTEPPPVVDRVTVSPSSPSIEEGETQRFTARAYESDNTEITGKSFRWTSSNTSVATVSPSSGTSTTATGVSDGSTTITASVDGESGTASLTVTDPPMLRSRTGTLSGRYSARGSVTLSEVAGGKLKLTITNFRSTAPDTWLALSENASISWGVGVELPSTARSFGEVTGQTSVDVTFTPPSGKDIDSYDYVILYCRAFNALISSNSLSE